jgi:hypothetical protein
MKIYTYIFHVYVSDKSKRRIPFTKSHNAAITHLNRTTGEELGELSSGKLDIALHVVDTLIFSRLTFSQNFDYATLRT